VRAARQPALAVAGLIFATAAIAGAAVVGVSGQVDACGGAGRKALATGATAILTGGARRAELRAAAAVLPVGGRIDTAPATARESIAAARLTTATDAMSPEGTGCLATTAVRWMGR
jgi:hypothetical protein